MKIRTGVKESLQAQCLYGANEALASVSTSLHNLTILSPPQFGSLNFVVSTKAYRFGWFQQWELSFD